MPPLPDVLSPSLCRPNCARDWIAFGSSLEMLLHFSESYAVASVCNTCVTRLRFVRPHVRSVIFAQPAAELLSAPSCTYRPPKRSYIKVHRVVRVSARDSATAKPAGSTAAVSHAHPVQQHGHIPGPEPALPCIAGPRTWARQGRRTQPHAVSV
jgi:hypothetical protein